VAATTDPKIGAFPIFQLTPNFHRLQYTLNSKSGKTGEKALQY